METVFFKTSPFNFVPISRTPWAGDAIPRFKRYCSQPPAEGLPMRVGESWEVSPGPEFPSYISHPQGKSGPLLTEVVSHHPKKILGKDIAAYYGGHVPLLLKWLHAAEPLSVQLHPPHGHPLLSPEECGKPEAWLVLDNSSKGAVWLGFCEGISENTILSLLQAGRVEECLYRYIPSQGDYISVPPGCIHAIDAGVLIAEPQYVLPGKSGKTWRIWDWNRLYDSQGNSSSLGQPRALHTQEAIAALDFSLPRGKELEKRLVRRMHHGTSFHGDADNPFALEIFSMAGTFTYQPLCPNAFSVVTVAGGIVTLRSLSQKSTQSLTLMSGESALISAAAGDVLVELKEMSCPKDKEEDRMIAQPFIAFFALKHPT